MRKLSLTRIKALWQNNRGSAVIESIYAVLMLSAVLICALSILSYSVQTNKLAYAGKRVARYIELSGQAHQSDMDALLRELLPNCDEIGATITVTPDVGWVSPAKRTIQLREGFTVTVRGYYKVTLANPAGFDSEGLSFNIPVIATIRGQSEVYWKTSAPIHSIGSWGW